MPQKIFKTSLKMTQISIWIDKTTRDKELEKKVPDLKPIIRIRGDIMFKGQEESDIAIIDTGAHISLIPFFIVQESTIKNIARFMKKPTPIFYLEKIRCQNSGRTLGEWCHPGQKASRECRVCRL